MVCPENMSEEPLVGRSNEATALTGGPSQWTVPLHAPLEGATAPPSVVPDLQYYKGSEIASVLPQRTMGSSLHPSPVAHVPWGKEGDECVICLGVMAAGEEVADLPGCNHTFHLQCAAKWLRTKVGAGRTGCCPVCNAEIFRAALIMQLRSGIDAPPSCFLLWLLTITLILSVIMLTVVCMGGLGPS